MIVTLVYELTKSSAHQTRTAKIQCMKLFTGQCETVTPTWQLGSNLKYSFLASILNPIE